MIPIAREEALPSSGNTDEDGPAPDLTKLFAPSGLAIIGATDRSASLGEIVLRNAIAATGLRNVHPVNPGRDVLSGLKCYRTADAIGQPVDLAFILLPAERCPDAVRDCGRAGIRFAIIGASGFGEGGGDGAALGEELLRAARESGVRLLGPNTNGTWNAVDDTHVGFNVSQGFRLRRGRVGLISQTGAMLGSTIAAVNERGVGIAYAVSTGNELDLKLHDHLAFMLSSPEVAAIGLAVDAVPDPRAFAAVMERFGGGKPVVLLQMGTSKAGSAATELHASRIADPSGAVIDLTRRLGIAVTSDFDAYISALMILGCGRPIPDHDRVLAVSSSGAGAALLADSGEAIGLRFEPLSEAAAVSLSGVMKLTQPHNPLDITGESRDPNWVGSVLSAFTASDPEAPITYLITLMKETPPDPRVMAFARMAEEQPERLWMACVPASLTPEYMARLSESGALVYSSLGMMFSGISLVREAMQLARRGVEATWLRSWKPQAAGGPSRTQAILVHDEAKQMLGRRGIAFPAERIADPDDIGVATAELAMPVALKLLSHERLHKAAADALALDLASLEAVVAAASRMQPAAGERFLIQQMVSAGLDIFLGYQEDARYGGMLLIGAGGSEVERLRDVQTVLLPATGEDLRAALRRLRMADTLFANGPAGTIWDVEAVIGAAEAFAAFVSDGRDGFVVAAEINPLRILGRGKGALALDARVVLAM